ncbi:50S ribosomal protein L20 [Waddlia chondrophila 2032/99]|uniref:Large ribosomal subunit protein bL20 n=2 Tax=Waddlia chondrophila TaxID=71667 RepID=D6YVW6_WADCW|nr:50S ribosomal protein L20 [Waddlia chondrophila]ADI38277.1 50S ribosomal protein L20 [Waddlia chondrophila WSU 86-1044]CCB91358.1 50S ribosomal protein L20 [Waddlia chondrophila 2032/99]
MVRATNAVATRRRKKRLLKRAKGFWGDRKNHLKMTKDAVMRALAFNYVHRKQKKRDFRKLWITRLSAAAKIHGISYSKLVHGLKRSRCELDRKMLADMAISDPDGFKQVVGRAKEALA